MEALTREGENGFRKKSKNLNPDNKNKRLSPFSILAFHFIPIQKLCQDSETGKTCGKIPALDKLWGISVE